MGKKKLALIGTRGMVGSVLVDLMEKDTRLLEGLESFVLTTSQAGRPCPHPWAENKTLLSALDLDILRGMDIILTCQGSDYTRKWHSRLRETGWQGYWLDSASFLRMEEDSTLVLDPINLPIITRALEAGKRDFIMGNCTVSLALMALGGLFREGLVDWVGSMTYQSVSGAGARATGEFLTQLKQVAQGVGEVEGASFQEWDERLSTLLREGQLERDILGAPLALGPIPWIDSGLPSGQSREEWKGGVETAKILGLESPFPWDGTCVRVGAVRCHSFGAVVKLAEDIPLEEVESLIASSNRWVKLIPNERDATVSRLHPALVSGRPDILVGRVRKLAMGGEYINVFSTGDQLLWGATLPLVRMLGLLVRGRDWPL